MSSGTPTGLTPNSNEDDLFNVPSTSTPESSDNPFDQLAFSSTSRVKQIWAVGGGKGGAGKSLVSSSLAISLSRTGNKVIAVDLDLGGANLHTTLGAGFPQRTLSDFLTNRVNSLQECVSPTGIPNLDIISGAQDSVMVADLTREEKVRLLQKFRELDADYLIFDLGAGTHINTLDFFIYSDVGLIVLLPEPTAIENAYRFIKSIYYRRLLLSSRLSDLRELVKSAMDSKGASGIKTPSDLYSEAKRLNPQAALLLKQEIQSIQLKLIMNMTRTQTDIDIGFSVKSVCKKYFGIDVDYIGYLDYDSAVWQAVRRKRPLMLEFPNSQLVSSIDRIVNYLFKRYGHIRNNFF